MLAKMTPTCLGGYHEKEEKKKKQKGRKKKEKETERMIKDGAILNKPNTSIDCCVISFLFYDMSTKYHASQEKAKGKNHIYKMAGDDNKGRQGLFVIYTVYI